MDNEVCTEWHYGQQSDNLMHSLMEEVSENKRPMEDMYG